MVANPNKVDINSIEDYSDLSNPSLEGLVCVRKRSSPYNQSLVANQIVNKGEEKTKEWLKGMISNISQPFFGGDIVSLQFRVSRLVCRFLLRKRGAVYHAPILLKLE